MVDAWVVATGFGLLPLMAGMLWLGRETLHRHEAAVWGLLIGVVAFVGLAHTGATILEGNAFLKFEASLPISAGVATGGIYLGLLLGWLVVGRAGPGVGAPLGALAAAAIVYVALHSVSDGLVLGESYVGPGSSGYPLTAVVVGGTLLHRFAEGALILVPALLASWKPAKAFGALLVALVAAPAAYIPIALLSPAALSPATVALEQAISVFASSAEAGFAVLLLFAGLMPRVRLAKDAKWAVWAGLAFTAMLLIHFLVE